MLVNTDRGCGRTTLPTPDHSGVSHGPLVWELKTLTQEGMDFRAMKNNILSVHMCTIFGTRGNVFLDVPPTDLIKLLGGAMSPDPVAGTTGEIVATKTYKTQTTTKKGLGQMSQTIRDTYPEMIEW